MPYSTEPDDVPVRLTRKQIAASGLAATPVAVAAIEALQDQSYDTGPAATAAAQAVADQGVADAAAAATAATGAQTSADTAQGRADDAYGIAETAVQQDVGPVWTLPTGTASRATFAAYAAQTAALAYDPAQVQALMDAVQTMSRAMVAIVTDLKANGALT